MNLYKNIFFGSDQINKKIIFLNNKNLLKLFLYIWLKIQNKFSKISLKNLV